MDSKYANFPFFIHYLDPNLKGYINRMLLKTGITLPKTYPSEKYSQIAVRLRRVYDRNQQYPQTFIRSWTITGEPGYVVYAADGESLHIYHGVRKRTANVNEISSFIARGIVVIYYGNVFFRGFECYITSRRKAQMVDNDEFVSTPLYSEKECALGLVSPFSENLRVLKVGCIAMLSSSPAYIRALDTILQGDNIFAPDGTFIMPESMRESNQRIVCPIQYRDTIQVTELYQLTEVDVLCIPPLCLVPYNRVDTYNTLVEYFKRSKRPIVGDTGLTTFSIDLTDKSYRIDSFISATGPIRFDPSRDVPSEVLPCLLLTSYAYTIEINASELEKLVALTPVKPVTRTVSDSLFSNALQLRKTFLAGNEMGYVVIANKGAMKTTVTKLLNEFRPELIVIDSDVYGRWITEHINGRSPNLRDLNSDACTVMPYFEAIASELLRDKSTTNIQKLTHFKEMYARIISNPDYGAAVYQDAIYKSYGTTQVLLFCHTTAEANLFSGRWQQTVIRPINNTLHAVKDRNRSNKDENVFLHCAYQALTPMHNRASIPWVDFFLLVAPEAIDALNRKLHDVMKGYSLSDAPEM